MKIQKSHTFFTDLKPLLLAALTAATLAGCDNRDDFVFTNGQFPGNGNPPVAAADQYSALGNTIVEVDAQQGVLSNDQNAAGAAVTVVTEPSTGTLTLNQDGSFSYDSETGFTGDISFRYAVTNDFGRSEADVTLSLDQAAWFVDNSVATGDGSQESPFTTLAAAQNASEAGDIIFVFAGDETDTGQDEGVVLKANQQLLSERVGLSLQNGVVTRNDIAAQIVPNQVIIPADPSVRPVISNSTGRGVVVTENNTIRGFRIENTADAGIGAVDTDPGPGHTIVDNVIANPGLGSPGIALFSVTGQTVVTDNTVTGVDGAGAGIGVLVGFLDDDNPSVTVSNNTLEDTATEDPQSGIAVVLTDYSTTLTGSPSIDITCTNNNISGDNNGGGYTNAIVIGGPVDDIPFASGVTGTLNANLSENTIDGTDGNGILIDFPGDSLQQGTLALALTVDQNTFTDTGDEAIEIYLESKVNTTGTISGNTKASGEGGGLDIRSGRDAVDEVNTELTISQNSFTANGSNERGIQLRADGDTGQSTFFCIGNTLSDDGDALSGYRIVSANDASLTVVSDGDDVSGFAQNGMIATSRDTSTLLVGVRNGDFTGGSDEGVFMEGQDMSTLCAQVLDNVFDAFRIRQDAGSSALVQLESMPASTTVDTNTGSIDDSDGVTGVNLGDCNIPATP